VRIPSGTTDQYIYFVAVDATDFATRETGLSSFTVYRSRDGGVAAAMTTPTINETDSSNMPGVYELLLDEDMTIGSGNDTEEMVFHITHAGMAPVTRTIELYRPKITVGNTLDVTATGAAGIDWGNVENPTTSVDLSATSINLCDTVTTNTDMRGTDSAATASALATVDSNVDAILTDTGTTLPATLATIAGYIDTEVAAIKAVTDVIPDAGAMTSIAQASALATVDSNVDAILVDTGTTLPATLTTIEGKVDTVDTVVDGIQTDLSNGTDGLGAIKADTAAILTDTGTTIEGHLTDIKGATFSGTTDSLEAIRDRGDAAWVTGAGGSGITAEDVWTYSTRVLTANTNLNDLDAAGVRSAVGMASANMDTQLGTIDSNVDAILVDTGTSIPADIAALNNIAATDIVSNGAITTLAGAVVNVDLVDTCTTNTDMRGTDSAATASALATVDANVGAIKASTDAILIDTNELQGDWTNGGRLDLILDAILADTDADVVLTATERNAIADAILNRDMSTGTDSGSDVVRTVRQALRMNRNKVSISGGTLTVTKEDDTTASWSASVTTTAGDPITTIDPA
jgi:hypothetical protein